MNERDYLDSIVTDIARGQAVLLLGHGFQLGIHQELYELFQRHLKDDLLHFYGRDGLFLFSDKDAKVTAQREAVTLYEHYHSDISILRKIAELPFKLMINTNPDKNLANIFGQFGLPLQFDYFSSKNKEVTIVERPTQEHPLLYNLCGSYEDQESLILDYDDLFDLLKDLLPNNKVPTEVRILLEKATTYIFIGFQFEQWYTQLFLRYLNMKDRLNNNSSNYVLKTSLPDKDTEQFFIDQFNVKYIGADTAYFDKLHAHFIDRYPQKIRNIEDEFTDDQNEIISLIRGAKYQEVFNLLREKMKDSQIENFIISTESQYNVYLKEKKAGTTNAEGLGVTLAKIRKNLIEITKMLP